MQETPALISVALCTYNGALYLSEQLDSLLGQDYPRLEIVAVDDASTDHTIDILQEYAAKDARIHVYRNSENLGFLTNFAKALQLCRGELIAPCDQDDVWLPSKLSRLYETLGDGSMSYCDSELVDAGGKSLQRRVSDKLLLGDIDDPLALAFYNCVSGHAMLFRQTLVEAAMPIPPILFHDWWLAVVASSRGRIMYCSEALVLYRQHDAAVTDFAGLHRKGKSSKAIGYGVRERRVIGERIEYMGACAQGCDGRALATLAALLKCWERRFVCLTLCGFLLRYRHRFYALLPNGRLRRIRRALKYFWGLKTKRIIQPRKYGGN